MSREGISSYEEILGCQILDKYNLTDTKVPAVTIKGGFVKFNMNAIHLLDDVLYVNILLNPKEKYMLVVPCDKYAPHAIDWCKVVKKTKKIDTKDFRSKYLSPKLYNMMGWDANNSYRIQCIHQDFGDGKVLLYFDLTEYVTLVSTTQELKDGRTRKRTRPYYLASWQDSFGPPLKDVVAKVNRDFMGFYVGDSENETDEQDLELFEKKQSN